MVLCLITLSDDYIGYCKWLNVFGLNEFILIYIYSSKLVHDLTKTKLILKYYILRFVIFFFLKEKTVILILHLIILSFVRQFFFCMERNTKIVIVLCYYFLDVSSHFNCIPPVEDLIKASLL